METKKSKRVTIACAIVLVAALLVMVNTVSASSSWPDELPSVHTTIVARVYGGDSNRSIVKLDISDALYLRTTRYGDLVPLMDGDGTPVTYEEFLERMSELEE